MLRGCSGIGGGDDRTPNHDVISSGLDRLAWRRYALFIVFCSRAGFFGKPNSWRDDQEVPSTSLPNRFRFLHRGHDSIHPALFTELGQLDRATQRAAADARFTHG